MGVQVHIPFLQKSGSTQTLLQVPQLLLSVLRLTQAPLQTVVPVGQVQTPAEQPAPLAQTCPQAPQLFTSDAVLTQVPPQLTRPVGHVQAPATHAAPAGQTRPQAPQLFTLVWTFVSQPSAATPLQSAKPGLQVMPQVPEVQKAVPFCEGQT